MRNEEEFSTFFLPSVNPFIFLCALTTNDSNKITSANHMSILPSIKRKEEKRDLFHRWILCSLPTFMEYVNDISIGRFQNKLIFNRISAGFDFLFPYSIIYAVSVDIFGRICNKGLQLKYLSLLILIEENGFGPVTTFRFDIWIICYCLW